VKPDNVFIGFEWANGDVPAVIPKRLWDSMLKLQESLLAVTDAVCCGTKEMIAEVRKGECVDDVRLSALDKIVSETLDEMGNDKEKLRELQSLLKWVPPANFGTTH
jgi:hypothetical protein